MGEFDTQSRRELGPFCICPSTDLPVFIDPWHDTDDLVCHYVSELEADLGGDDKMLDACTDKKTA